MTWFVIGLSWFAVYSVACWLYPYAACPRCKGKGRRVRIGRKTWNAVKN